MTDAEELALRERVAVLVDGYEVCEHCGGVAAKALCVHCGNSDPPTLDELCPRMLEWYGVRTAALGSYVSMGTELDGGSWFVLAGDFLHRYTASSLPHALALAVIALGENDAG